MQFGLIKRVHVINEEVTSQKKLEDTDYGVMNSDWIKEYKEVFKGIG